MRFVIGRADYGSLEAARMAGQKPEPEDAAMQRKRAIWAAIGNRDLAAFRSLMPADPVERRQSLRETYALASAFRASSLPIVRQILEWDPDALSDRNLGSPKGNLLLDVSSNWADFDRRQRDGKPAAHAPTADEHVELFQVLLDAGADGNGESSSQSPIAVLSKIPASPQTVRVARMLLDHGASIERDAGRRYVPPLAEAAANQNVEFVRLMLELRQPGQDALDEAIVSSPIVPANAALPVLLEHGANINADATKYGVGRFTPAWNAGTHVNEPGGRELMRLMIRYKVDPNGLIRGTDSPLMTVMHDHELMQGLLDLGADTAYRNGEGDFALHRAARVPEQVTVAPGDTRPLKIAAPALDPAVKARSVALLLQHGADPNALDGYGRTPLMLTGRDDTEVVRLLLDRGGRVVLDDKRLANVHDEGATVGSISWSLLEYRTALATELTRRTSRIPAEDCGAVFYAAQTGATQTLSLLLDRHATTDLESDFAGLRPLHVAAMQGQTAAVGLLLERRVARVDDASSMKMGWSGGHGMPFPALYGRQTALMLAAGAGHIDTVRELLRRGADVTRTDTQGETAVDYALEAGHQDIVTLLQQR
jgi:ankyrin repeat protein